MKKYSHPPAHHPVRTTGWRPDAFTLIELLVVMGVIVILLGVIVPATTQILRGSGMTQSGEMVDGQFALARQSALTSNRPVQLRFYQLPVVSVGSATNYCAMQSFRVEDSGQVTALTKLQALSTNIIFAPDTHSSLLSPPGSAKLSVSGSSKIAAYNNATCNYVGFQFLPDGSTDLDLTVATSVGGWYVTLVEANKPIPSGQPTNFYTLRIEPIMGHTRLFRP